MYTLIIYRNYETEGNSDPLAVYGPFEQAFLAANFWNENKPRLIRLYNTEYAKLDYDILKLNSSLESKDKVKEGDCVRLNDPDYEYNQHCGMVHTINEKLNAATVQFNKKIVIVPLDKLEIIYEKD